MDETDLGGEGETMNPVDEMLRDHVRPVMAAAGFERQGRNFVRFSERGDWALVEVRPIQYRKDRLAFSVMLSIAVAEDFAFISRDKPPGEKVVPSSAYALWRKELVGPPAARFDPTEPEGIAPAWGFDRAEGGAACGVLLVEELTETAIPRLLELLDRENLLAMVRSEYGALDRPPAELLLRLYDGPVDEVAALADEWDARWSEWNRTQGREVATSPLSDWVRPILAQRRVDEERSGR